MWETRNAYRISGEKLTGSWTLIQALKNKVFIHAVATNSHIRILIPFVLQASTFGTA